MLQWHWRVYALRRVILDQHLPEGHTSWTWMLEKCQATTKLAEGTRSFFLSTTSRCLNHSQLAAGLSSNSFVTLAEWGVTRSAVQTKTIRLFWQVTFHHLFVVLPHWIFRLCGFCRQEFILQLLSSCWSCWAPHSMIKVTCQTDDLQNYSSIVFSQLSSYRLLGCSCITAYDLPCSL